MLACLVFLSMWLLFFIRRQGSHHLSPVHTTRNKGFFVLSHLQSNTTTQLPVATNHNKVRAIQNATQDLTYISIPPGLPTWKLGTFCDKFIGRTFRDRVPMCSSTVSSSDSVVCLKNPDSNLMVRCSIEGLAINPRRLHNKFFGCEKCNLDHLDAAWLLNEASCPKPTISALARTTEDGDYQWRIIHQIMKAPQKPALECQKWVNKTVFVLTTQPHHIYFRFLDYFNLHKAILDTVDVGGDFQVLRISDKKNYMFPEYEKWLFPELITLNDLPNGTVCFGKVVFAPWTYSAVPFRCKMEDSTRGRCLECNGRKLYGTAFMSFRKRVISACSLVDQSPEERARREKRSLVVILRKPYNRWDGDFHANFQRVLTNQNDVVSTLTREFPLTNVTTTFMENMPICEQIRMVHDADVLMGVHGAGLVHSWWLQEDALLFELVPVSMISNPSFKTLTKLSGRRYVGFTISSGVHAVSA